MIGSWLAAHILAGFLTHTFLLRFGSVTTDPYLLYSFLFEYLFSLLFGYVLIDILAPVELFWIFYVLEYHDWLACFSFAA